MACIKNKMCEFFLVCKMNNDQVHAVSCISMNVPSISSIFQWNHRAVKHVKYF